MKAAFALMVAWPLSVSALLLGEFTQRLQSFMLSVVFPLSETSVTLPRSSASTQALPPALRVATARVLSVGGPLRNMRASCNGCGREMSTSTALPSAVWLPEAGGLFTVTAAPLTSSVEPYVGVTLFALSG